MKGRTYRNGVRLYELGVRLKCTFLIKLGLKIKKRGMNEGVY